MRTAALTENGIKAAVKEAKDESLRENRKLLRKICQEMVADLFEDLAFAKAMDEGRKTPFVSRDKIDRLLSR